MAENDQLRDEVLRDRVRAVEEFLDPSMRNASSHVDGS
jgi:hypothetical protein